MALKIQPLYLYGSENPKARCKVHLCDDYGKILCGRKLHWGEVTAEIKLLDGDIMYTIPFGGNSQKQIPSPTYVWKLNKCLVCEKKYNNICNTVSDLIV